MSEQYRGPKALPDGHRPIAVVLDAGLPVGPIRVEGSIPDGELYPSEIRRLSRKALRGCGYSPAEWNDHAGTMLKVREATEATLAVGGHAWVTLREIHDATLPPEQSLRSLQLITVNDFGQVKDGHRIYPTEYIDYDLRDDTMQRWRIEEYYEGMDPVALDRAGDATRVAGGDRERLILHNRLVFLAGE